MLCSIPNNQFSGKQANIVSFLHPGLTSGTGSKREAFRPGVTLGRYGAKSCNNIQGDSSGAQLLLSPSPVLLWTQALCSLSVLLTKSTSMASNTKTEALTACRRPAKSFPSDPGLEGGRLIRETYNRPLADSHRPKPNSSHLLLEQGPAQTLKSLGNISGPLL